jgi:hypothetical protein
VRLTRSSVERGKDLMPVHSKAWWRQVEPRVLHVAARADKLAEARRATPPSLSTHASRSQNGRVARLYVYEQTRALEVALRTANAGSR